MDEAVRELVHRRANHRCEYCRLPQSAARFFSFHIEHIRAQQHRGSDDPSNLALACPDCNRFKGPNLTSVDPETDEVVPLFNPRVHAWDQHFTVRGAEIIGVTPIGRATVALLQVNEEERREMRAELLARGEL